MRALLIGLMAVMVAAGASIGRPEGGPRDEVPPVFVRSNPTPGALNVERGKVDIIFDENIKLEDIADKLVISPAQKQNPAVSSNGRRITVELRDTLRDSTTYTFDFSDAIRDLNEGNILDGFALDFSTGPSIDSLRISGMVLDSHTLAPQHGILVGVHRSDADTVFSCVRMERVARTDDKGRFSLRGLTGCIIRKPAFILAENAVSLKSKDPPYHPVQEIPVMGYGDNNALEAVQIILQGLELIHSIS